TPSWKARLLFAASVMPGAGGPGEVEKAVAGLAGIRALWRHGPWRTWAVAAVLGRLLSTMVVLGYVLVAEAVYDSIPLGALLAGTATFSAGFAAPLIGRLLDRRGLRRGLLRCLWITAAVLALESLVVLSAAPPSLLFVLAVLQGVAYG